MTKEKEKLTELSSNNVSKTLGQVRLSSELRNLLTRMGGSLQVTFDPAAQQPIIRVLSAEGKTLCSVGELENVSGYHRFLTEAVKTAEKESAADIRLAETARLMTILKKEGGTIPERMLQENSSKKIELDVLLNRIKINIDKIKDLADHRGYKEYLLLKGDALERVLVYEMIMLVGPDKISKDMRVDALFNAKIPYWLYGKFISNDWVKNETVSVKALIFPKNNFLKGISFTTKEMKDEEFVNFNQVVMGYSGHLPLLVKSQLVKSMIGEAKDATSLETLEESFKSFMWVLHDGENTAELIQPRIDGKTPPSVSNTRMGKGKEGDLPRLKREMLNRLTQLSHNLSMLMHGLVLTEDALVQFWSHIYAGADQWELSPTKNLYDHIKEEDSGFVKFGEIVRLTNPAVNKMLFEILFLKLEIYDPVLKVSYSKELTEAAKLVVPKAQQKAEGETQDEKPEDAIPNFGISDVRDVTLINEAERKEAKRFLGIRDKKSVVKKGRRSARRLSKKVLKGLSELTDYKNGQHLSEQVKNWLETSFTTSEDILQEIALEMILGAVGRVDILDGIQESNESDEESDDN